MVHIEYAWQPVMCGWLNWLCRAMRLSQARVAWAHTQSLPKATHATKPTQEPRATSETHVNPGITHLGGSGHQACATISSSKLVAVNKTCYMCMCSCNHVSHGWRAWMRIQVFSRRQAHPKPHNHKDVKVETRAPPRNSPASAKCFFV